MTNLEKIKKYSADEMADFIIDSQQGPDHWPYPCDCCVFVDEHKCYTSRNKKDCFEGVIGWLNSEVEP